MPPQTLASNLLTSTLRQRFDLPVEHTGATPGDSLNIAFVAVLDRGLSCRCHRGGDVRLLHLRLLALLQLQRKRRSALTLMRRLGGVCTRQGSRSVLRSRTCASSVMCVRTSMHSRKHWYPTLGGTHFLGCMHPPHSQKWSNHRRLRLALSTPLMDPTEYCGPISF